MNTEYFTGSGFDDVVEDEWYAPYVKWAADNGIVLGYDDGTFGLNNKITIEQAAIMLMRYAKYAEIEIDNLRPINKYDDADQISDWATEAMT